MRRLACHSDQHSQATASCRPIAETAQLAALSIKSSCLSMRRTKNWGKGKQIWTQKPEYLAKIFIAVSSEGGGVINTSGLFTYFSFCKSPQSSSFLPCLLSKVWKCSHTMQNPYIPIKKITYIHSTQICTMRKAAEEEV